MIPSCHTCGSRGDAEEVSPGWTAARCLLTGEVVEEEGPFGMYEASPCRAYGLRAPPVREVYQEKGAVA